MKLGGVRWENLSLAEARAVISLDIGNANEFPVDLNALNYALSLGGHRVVDTSLRRATSFTAGGRSTLDIPISFKPADLGLAALGLFRGSGARYELSGSLDGHTSFGDLRFPINSKGDATFTK